MRIEGGCLCGAVRYRVQAAPVLASICYCRDCQLVSGGSPACALTFARSDVQITRGELTTFESRASSGNEVQRLFCSLCGTHVFAGSGAAAQLLAVKVGTLDDPSVFRPLGSIWVGSAQPFHRPDTTLPQWKTVPSPVEMAAYLQARGGSATLGERAR